MEEVLRRASVAASIFVSWNGAASSISGKEQVHMKRFPVLRFTPGNTEAVFKVVNGFLYIYTYFISGIPFLCSPNCSRISMEIAFILIRGIRFLFNHDFRMGFQKVFIIKSNISDNAKSDCENAVFMQFLAFCKRLFINTGKEELLEMNDTEMKLSEKMKVLVAYNQSDHRLENNYPVSECGPDDILIKTDGIVSSIYSLDEWQKAFEKASDKDGGLRLL